MALQLIELPDDVLSVIFANLSGQDVARIGCCNRTTKALVFDDAVWKYLFMRDFPRITDQPSDESVSFYARYKEYSAGTPWTKLLAAFELSERTSVDPTSESKFVLMGPDFSGKSALVIRRVQKVFVSNYDPTIEDCYRFQAPLGATGGRTTTCDVLDTAGQPEYQAMWDQYLLHTDVLCIVVACDNAAAMDSCLALLHSALKLDRWQFQPNRCIVLVRNKIDLPVEQHVLQQQQLMKLAREYRCHCMETSALTGVGVMELFEAMLKMRLLREPGRAPEPTRKKKCVVQ
eukprot:TRINITY_DN11100_c0_g1_i1.p1 TRINITY_DN11100_c0_g1~~TRINITY_DN11100_c0_g1_i1.p1  ORF type:complete len:289 (-),score=39.41 TRINITY_DN11100_c0_g1_i1:347-1213(-)